MTTTAPPRYFLQLPFISVLNANLQIAQLSNNRRKSDYMITT
jgi:hypothetical protein